MNVKMNAKYNKDLPWQVANLKKILAFTLVGPTRDNLAIDPLAVLHLDN